MKSYPVLSAFVLLAVLSSPVSAEDVVTSSSPAVVEMAAAPVATAEATTAVTDAASATTEGAPVVDSTVAATDDADAAAEPAPTTSEPAPTATDTPTLKEVTLKDGTKIVIDNGMVFVVAADGGKTPAPDGQHETTDGAVVTVKNGREVVEEKPAEATPAEDKPAELAPAETTSAE